MAIDQGPDNVLDNPDGASASAHYATRLSTMHQLLHETWAGLVKNDIVIAAILLLNRAKHAEEADPPPFVSTWMPPTPPPKYG